MVGDAKDTSHLVGEEPSQIFVHLVHDYAGKCDVAIFDDDAYRWDGAQGIAAERGLAEDGAVDVDADTVVIGRKREDLDVVDDFFHTWNSLDYVSCGAGENGSCNLPVEGNFAAIERVTHLIEYAEEGERDELVTDLVSQPLLVRKRSG